MMNHQDAWDAVLRAQPTDRGDKAGLVGCPPVAKSTGLVNTNAANRTQFFEHGTVTFWGYDVP
jgi:hypothetical protein